MTFSLGYFMNIAKGAESADATFTTRIVFVKNIWCNIE